MRNKSFQIFGLAFLLLGLNQCTKVLAIAKDYPTETISKSYNRNIDQVFHQSLSSLDKLGYQVANSDPYQYQITTVWRPTTSGSHYLSLFNRRDDSANAGAYYELVLNFAGEGNATRVDVHTKVKALSGKLTSSKEVEKKFFASLDDAMRSPNLQITNVGLGEAVVSAPVATPVLQQAVPAPVQQQTAPVIPAEPPPSSGRYVDPKQPVQPIQ